MNHPKRTQEIATILCELLGGDIELPRMIVGILKDTETEGSRDWHIHRLRPWRAGFCSSVWQHGGHVPCGDLWDALVVQVNDFGMTFGPQSPAIQLLRML